MNRLYGTCITGLLVCGAFVFFAAGRPWVTANIEARGATSDSIAVTGTQANPLIGALAVVVIAAALGVVAAGPALRRLIGGVVAVIGMLGPVLILSADRTEATARAVRESPFFIGDNWPEQSTITIWPWLAAVSFVLIAVLGTVIIGFARHWPTMSRRYETRKPISPEPERDPWSILDDGNDPTL